MPPVFLVPYKIITGVVNRQIQAYPPSTGRMTPVTYDAASEGRNMTAASSFPESPQQPAARSFHQLLLTITLRE